MIQGMLENLGVKLPLGVLGVGMEPDTSDCSGARCKLEGQCLILISALGILFFLLGCLLQTQCEGFLFLGFGGYFFFCPILLGFVLFCLVAVSWRPALF